MAGFRSHWPVRGACIMMFLIDIRIMMAIDMPCRFPSVLLLMSYWHRYMHCQLIVDN